MSIDFDAIIKSAMKDGASAEDLAKGFTEAMNAINSKKTEENNRIAWINTKLNEAFAELDNEDETYDTAAKVIVAIAAQENPDWDLDACEQCYHSVSEFLPEMIKTFNQFNKSFDKFTDVLNKSKETVRRGADRVAQKVAPAVEVVTDREKIEKFLKEIFGD